jgi:hypothetical protein
VARNCATVEAPAGPGGDYGDLRVAPDSMTPSLRQFVAEDVAEDPLAVHSGSRSVADPTRTAGIGNTRGGESTRIVLYVWIPCRT